VNETPTSGPISGSRLQQRPKIFRDRGLLNPFASLRLHWPEYLMEAGELALYMLCTCAFATLLQHPASPVRHLLVGDLSRRALMGLAIGATVIAIILTPWGKQSGGHFNPAITIAFYRLGKMGLWDALFYATAQFSGAIGGVAIARYALRGAPGNDAVRYAITVPGVHGRAIALAAELAISFLLMITVLFVSNREPLARYTAYFVGALYAMFITFETPLSGMSMNPARSFGSAFHADYWRALWIYFTAPTLGTLAAAQVFLRARRGVGPYCAKLHHANNKRCIFHHGYRTGAAQDFRAEEMVK
jgi:aquaporin Z